MEELPPPGRFDRFRSLALTLLVGFSAALLALIFVQLGSEMAEGETRAFDMSLLRAAQALRDGHPWVAAVMRDLSGLGSTAVLALCTTVTVGYLALVSARKVAWLVALAVTAGAVGISVLKAIFERGRPDAAFAELVVSGLSFPSGHAGMSAIVFLTVGALLAGTRRRPVERTYILAVATFMTVLVGLSRVALGVHWATDVLAGWAYGFAWALVWLLIARRQVRGGGPDSDRDQVLPP
ncbi:MAG: phosphatase PAP2 family protein [Rubrivivax sp.]